MDQIVVATRAKKPRTRRPRFELSDQDILQAIEAKLSGVLDELHQVHDVLVSVYQSGGISPTLLSSVRELIQRLQVDRPLPHESDAALASGPVPNAYLTSRQIEVLRYLSEGHRPADIAHLLCVSEATVRTHIRDACSRLNVNRWFSAVVEARRLNLL